MSPSSTLSGTYLIDELQGPPDVSELKDAISSNRPQDVLVISQRSCQGERRHR